jgi:hypothetical protein
MLILSAVSFYKLGLPPLDYKPLPDLTQWALKIVPAIFFGVGGLMSAIYKFRNDLPGDGEELEVQK